jgi:hypothetical protein
LKRPVLPVGWLDRLLDNGVGGHGRSWRTEDQQGKRP